MLVIGNNVLDLKVVTLKNGKVIGTVKDILFNTNSQKVAGFLVSEKGLFSDTCFLSIDDIHSIGTDAVTISSEDLLQKKSASKFHADAKARSDHYLTNTQVLTESGDEIGTVDDILFDSQTGQIEDLVITQGISSLFSGDRKIPFSSVITLGKDNTIIKNDTGQKKSLQQSTENVKQKGEKEIKNNVSRAEGEVSKTYHHLVDEAKNTPRDIEKDIKKSPFLESMQDQATQIMDILQRNTEDSANVYPQNYSSRQQASSPTYHAETQNNSSHKTVYTHTISNAERQNNDNSKKELEPGTYAVTGEINFDKVEEEKIQKKDQLKGGENNG